MNSALAVPHHHLAALAELIGDIGEPCWASGPTAGALAGFDGFVLRPPFHILTSRDRNVRRIGHVVHTTHEIPLIDRTTKYGIPLLSPTRTLIDLARSINAEALTAAIDSAIRDGGTSEDFMHQRINALRTSGREGPTKLLAVLEGAEITRGGQSWLEREVLRLLDGAGFPKPATQVALGRRKDKLIRVDFHFPGTRIVVEALGYRWHRSGAQMQIDSERANRLLLDGFFPFQFTYSQVVADADSMLATIAEAFELHGQGTPVRT
jgi:very-short-patch-repair endonuclease